MSSRKADACVLGGTAATDFIPDGERRRWHFVSIDRTTAKVIDEHGEDFAD
jgi:hypothetical protein